MNFHKSFKKCSILTPDRHQKTTSNLLTIHLKGKLMCGNGSPPRGRYVHKPMVKFLGLPENVIFFNFLKIWMVSDNTIHRAFRIHKTL